MSVPPPIKDRYTRLGFGQLEREDRHVVCCRFGLVGARLRCFETTGRRSDRYQRLGGQGDGPSRERDRTEPDRYADLKVQPTAKDQEAERLRIQEQQRQRRNSARAGERTRTR